MFKRLFVSTSRMMLLAMVLSGSAWADDEGLNSATSGVKMLDPVVVTASKLLSPLSQVGSSVTVITAQDLETHGIQTVADALNLVPGLDIATTGGPGQQTDVFIRGADSGRTLVMINGVEVNDAMEPGRAANLAYLSADNVEKIEILRGPESAVFGSGAMGGVINIITKKGGKEWQAVADLSGGKYSTWNAAASASGMISNWDASLGASWNYSNGFPAAKRATLPPEPVPDLPAEGYRNWTVDASSGGPILPDWNARVSIRSVQGNTQLVDSANLANPDFSVRDQQQMGQVESDWRLNSWWKQIFTAGLSQIDRYYREVPQPSAPEYDADYLGRNWNLDWHNQMDFPIADSALAIGVNYRQEQGRLEDPVYGDFPERSAHSFGYYAEYRFQQGGLTLDAAAREDVQSQFGNAFTCRVAPAYSVDQTGTRLKYTLGTGFNAPSLYQLFAPIYGNVHLQPEKSTGADWGIEQKIFNQYKIGATYFQNDFENQVDFSSSYQYVNRTRTQTKGWEIFGVAEPLTDFIIRLGYTKLTANDLAHEETQGPLPLLRRADYKFTLDAGYKWNGASLQISAQRVGPHWDENFATYERVVVAPYTLVNVFAAYALTSSVGIYMRINNLLDADYTEALGYNSPRFGMYGGLKYAWK
jgi:vitamin B12 transporter